MLQEARGRDHLHLARIHVGLGHHAARAAEMVGVAVGVDQRHDRPGAEPGVGQLQGGLGGLRRGQGIDDDPAGLAGDEGGVGAVEAAHLPDPLSHLEQAVLGQQLRLAPQVGVHAGRRRALQEIIGRQVPDQPPAVAQDLRIGPRADKAPLGEGEVLPVGEIRLRGQGGRRDGQAQNGREDELLHVTPPDATFRPA